MATLDTTLLSSVQYVVIEPPDGGASYPSGLWTVDEVLGYANQRQSLLLKLTGARRTRATLATTPNVPRQPLPSDWILTIRAAWQKPDGTIVPICRGDSLEMDMAQQSWPYVGVPVPLLWMDTDEPTLQIQLAPAATDAGLLRLIYVAIGTTLTGAGVTLTLPDLLVPALKYGILADMFGKVGRVFDPARAAYGERRFAEGVEAVRVLRASWGEEG